MKEFTEVGLTNYGNIKPNNPCPYLKICLNKEDRCPRKNKYEWEFSCGLSRGFAIAKIGE